MSDVLEDVFGSDWGSDLDLCNEMADAIKRRNDDTDRSGRRRRRSSGKQSRSRHSPSSQHNSQRSEEPRSSRNPAPPSESDEQPQRSSTPRQQRRRSPPPSSDDDVPSRHSRSSQRDRARDRDREPPSRPRSARDDDLGDPQVSSEDERHIERKRRLERKRRISKQGASASKRAKRDRRPSPSLSPSPDHRQNSSPPPPARIPRRPKPEVPSSEEEPEREPTPEPPKPKDAFTEAMDDVKARRRPRAREVDESAVETQCIDFLERMMKARDDDMMAYKNGRPALNKLKMVRDVELMIMKTSHRLILLDNMLLSVVKAWLDPMPDGTLPNLQIRQTLLQILSDMPVDNEWIERLESSQGLGKVIHFLATKDTHPPNRRIAEKLMMKWSRLVYQNNANFHDLLEEYARPDNGNRIPKEGVAAERRHAMDQLRTFKSTRQKLESVKPLAGKQHEQVLAAVPRPAPMLYTTLAESDVVSHRSLRGGKSSKGVNRKVSKTMSELRRINKRGSARASRPSINGRDR